MPELDDLLRVRTRWASRLAPRFPAGSAHGYTYARRSRAGGRRWVLWLRVSLTSIVLVIGLIVMAAGVSQAVGGYADADTMAHAPVCAAGVDPTNTTENCVGTLNLTSVYGVFDAGGEESIELDLPPANSDNASFPTFPGDAQFDAAVGNGDGPAVLRAEFWRGQIVALTAGSPGVTVTTDQNPNNRGGVGLGSVLVGFALVLLAILLLIGIRAFRLRWLRPGLLSRLTVSGLAVWLLGSFVAGVCLVNQPARVAAVGVIAPSFTVGLTALVWLALVPGRKNRLRRGSGPRRPHPPQSVG